jgi:predicted acylesterase/phospholipase RssA
MAFSAPGSTTGRGIQIMPQKLPGPLKGKIDKQIALALQGGGALGSYQAGVYVALTEYDYQPDWVAGVSIGAINCAI